MGSFFSYLNWLYSEQYPMLYEILDNLFQLLNVILVLGALTYAGLQYHSSKKEKHDRERPFIYLDLEFESGLCTLVIKNTGGSPAKDVFIRFTPDIIIHGDNINTLPVLSGLPFLAPNKEIKMFIGSLNGNDNINREYQTKLTYTGMTGRSFQESQVIDPGKYLGISSIKRPGIHEIAKSIKEIAISTGNVQEEIKTLIKILKSGINIRNQNSSSYKLEELASLIRNMYQYTDINTLELFPDLYDSQILLKSLREQLLLQPTLTDLDYELINSIDAIRNYPFLSGSGNEYQNLWKQIIKLLNHKKHI